MKSARAANGAATSSVHRTMKRALCLLLLVSACGRKEVRAQPDAAPPIASAASPEAGPRAEVDAGGGCDFSPGWHGTVAGQDVYLRLREDPKDHALSGRYFYARTGLDIPLAGHVDGHGEVDLVEGDAAHSTGRFTGRCLDGVVSGTWSNGKTAQPFKLEPVSARENPLVATKRLKLVRPAKTVGTFGMKECVYEQAVFELFGLKNPAAEARINQQDVRALTSRIVSKDAYEDAKKCESGMTATFGVTVVATFRGFVTVETSGSTGYDGAAHPGNFVDYARTTWNLETGKPLGEKDLFARFPKALVERCVQAYGDAPKGNAIMADGHTFDVSARGIHIYGADYPHAASILTGQGPTLTWGALLREGALLRDSPAQRLWAGIAPAKAGDVECLLDDAKQRYTP